MGCGLRRSAKWGGGGRGGRRERGEGGRRPSHGGYRLPTRSPARGTKTLSRALAPSPPLLPPLSLFPISDLELAKFEAFLKKEGGSGVTALVRGRQRLAYPIKGHWEGIYVLYRYAAKRATSQGVQKLLSTPAVGAEQNVLRHMTFAT